MKNSFNKNIEILKKGKKLSKEEIKENEKETKIKMIIQYITPLSLAIIAGILYIALQNILVLCAFGAFMFLVLWGGDCSSRTCPSCKKWNSITWIKTERRIRETKYTKTILKYKLKKTKKYKYMKLGGRCKNCGCEFESEKDRMI